MNIAETHRREIAEKVVEQAHPGYSKMAQGEWYSDGMRLYHAQENRAWNPWPDSTQAFSVETLVYAWGGAYAENCDFSIESDDPEDLEQAVAFCLDYVPHEMPDGVYVGRTRDEKYDVFIPQASLEAERENVTPDDWPDADDWAADFNDRDEATLIPIHWK